MVQVQNLNAFKFSHAFVWDCELLCHLTSISLLVRIALWICNYRAVPGLIFREELQPVCAAW